MSRWLGRPLAARGTAAIRYQSSPPLLRLPGAHPANPCGFQSPAGSSRPLPSKTWLLPNRFVPMCVSHLTRDLLFPVVPEACHGPCLAILVRLITGRPEPLQLVRRKSPTPPPTSDFYQGVKR